MNRYFSEFFWLHDFQFYRKSEQDPDGMSSKNQRVDDFDEVPMDSDESGTCDLIVLGLPWKATEDDIRDYFEGYGPLTMVQLKTKDSGHSKGFAFIRFKDLDVQEKVLLTRHMIQERWCDVKVPESQELKNAKANASCKIFVARLSETITTEDLKEHFEKFGPVTDVYIPKPFRSFAFVSFQVIESRKLIKFSRFHFRHFRSQKSPNLCSAKIT